MEQVAAHIPNSAVAVFLINDERTHFYIAAGRGLAEEQREVTLPSILTVNAAQSYGEAARQGLGLIQAPRYGLAESLARGELVEVLRETPPSPSPVSLLYPRSRQLSPRLRVFIDWAARLFEGGKI